MEIDEVRVEESLLQEGYVAVGVRIVEEREPKEIREVKAKVKAPVKCLPVVNQAWLEYPKN
jgi:hypothetical protein